MTAVLLHACARPLDEDAVAARVEVIRAEFGPRLADPQREFVPPGHGGPRWRLEPTLSWVARLEGQLLAWAEKDVRAARGPCPACEAEAWRADDARARASLGATTRAEIAAERRAWREVGRLLPALRAELKARAESRSPQERR